MYHYTNINMHDENQQVLPSNLLVRNIILMTSYLRSTVNYLHANIVYIIYYHHVMLVVRQYCAVESTVIMFLEWHMT